MKTGNNYKLSNEQKAQAVIAYKQGDSLNEIARRYGVTNGAIRSILRRRGAQIRSIKEGMAARRAKHPPISAVERCRRYREARLKKGLCCIGGCRNSRTNGTGFQVLCFNCNMGKHFFGECPHKRTPSRPAFGS